MIKEVLDKLTEEDRNILIHAYEKDIPYCILLPKNKFIGVYLNEESKRYSIEEKIGSTWYYGSINV